jgi:hypothetical protein
MSIFDQDERLRTDNFSVQSWLRALSSQGALCWPTRLKHLDILSDSVRQDGEHLPLADDLQTDLATGFAFQSHSISNG